MLSLNTLLMQNTPAPTSQPLPMMTGDLTRGLESNPDALVNSDFTRALETQLDQLAEQLGLDGGLDIQHLASLDAQGLIAELQAIMQGQPPAAPAITPTELTTPSTVNSDLGLTDAAKSLAALRLLLQVGMSATPHNSTANQSPQAASSTATTTLDDDADHSTLSAITNELNQLARYWLEYPASPTSIENATDSEQTVNPVLEQAAAAWQSLSRRADQSSAVSQLTTPAVASSGASGELITPPTTVLQSNATATAGGSTPVNNDAQTTLLNAILAAVNNTQPAVHSTPATGATNQSTAAPGGSTPVNNDAQTTLLNAILAAVNNTQPAVHSTPATGVTNNPIVQVMAPLMPTQSLNESSSASLNTPSSTGVIPAMALAFNQQRSMGNEPQPDSGSLPMSGTDNTQAAATSSNVLFAADLFAQLKATSFNPLNQVAHHSPAPFTLDLAQLVQPGGAATLAEQLQLIARAQDGTAELKLHPASLGALDVRISLDGNNAHVHFASANATVRDALEAALPRLRDALMQDGVTLGQVSVSDHASQHWRQPAPPLVQQTADNEIFGDDAAVIAAETTTVAPRSTLSALARKLDLFV